MAEFVKATHVYLNNTSQTVEDVLNFLADQAKEQGFAEDRDAVYQALLDRETLGTTGMVGGFAIPHAKSAAIKEAGILVVKAADHFEWKTLDDEPVKVAIALFIPDGDEVTLHLRLLSQIAVMLMREDFCRQLSESEDPEYIAKLINEGLQE